MTPVPKVYSSGRIARLSETVCWDPGLWGWVSVKKGKKSKDEVYSPHPTPSKATPEFTYNSSRPSSVRFLPTLEMWPCYKYLLKSHSNDRMLFNPWLPNKRCCYYYYYYCDAWRLSGSAQHSTETEYIPSRSNGYEKGLVVPLQQLQRVCQTF